VHVRLEPKALCRALTALLVWGGLSAACARPAADLRSTWRIEPNPPLVQSAASVRLTLRDARGEPVPGAALQLEAHMGHPGMTPVTARLTEQAPGLYDARVVLTMAGSWQLVAAGTLSDGRRVTVQTEVRAADPPGPK
jgi:hypothetical protein